MSQVSIRVAALLTREVNVQWYEGVALVHGVCRQLLHSGASNSEFPGPADIGLSRDGAVSILGTSPTPAVAAAAHLLADMLADDAPVRLRLAVTQAAGERAEGDLRQFSDTIAYFAPPDTEGVIRKLVERVMLAPQRAAGNDGKPVRAHAEPAPAPATPKRKEAKPARTRVVLVAAAIGFVIVVGALGFTGRRNDRMAAAFDVVKQALSAAAPMPADEGPTKPDVTTQDAKGIATTARRQRGGTSSGRSDAQTQDTPASESIGTLSVSLLPGILDSASVATGATTRGADQTDQVVANPAVGDDDLSRIYSTSDSAIVPPSQIYPTLPIEPTGSASGSLTIVDLVVGTDGLVEKVRFRTLPRDVNESMLLSAAKAWRFRPATSDGRPVRFLHTVAITRF